MGITQAPLQQAQLEGNRKLILHLVLPRTVKTYTVVSGVQTQALHAFLMSFVREFFKADIVNASRRVCESQPRPAAEYHIRDYFDLIGLKFRTLRWPLKKIHWLCFWICPSVNKHMNLDSFTCPVFKFTQRRHFFEMVPDVPDEQSPEISWSIRRQFFEVLFCHSFILSAQPNIVFLSHVGILVNT